MFDSADQVDKHKSNLNMSGKKYYHSSLAKFRYSARRESRHDPICGPYQCQECGEYFRSPGHLDSHIKRIHRQQARAICAVCNIGCESVYFLKKHMKSQHGAWVNIPVICGQCDKKCLDLDRLTIHQMKHLPLAPCKYCGMQFQRKRALVTHERRHEGTHPKFTCPYCFRTFPTVGNMSCHMTRLHTRASHLDRKCAFCGMILANMPDYAFHIAKHFDPHTAIVKAGRPGHCHSLNKCKFCWRSFGSVRACDEHSTRVHGAEDFKCPICGESFPDPKEGTRHVRLHDETSDRVFQCQTCKSQFRTFPAVMRHRVMKHPSDVKADGTLDKLPKDFMDFTTCKICGQSFIGRNRILQHVRKQEKIPEADINKHIVAHDGEETGDHLLMRMRLVDFKVTEAFKPGQGGVHVSGGSGQFHGPEEIKRKYEDAVRSKSNQVNAIDKETSSAVDNITAGTSHSTVSKTATGSVVSETAGSESTNAQKPPPPVISMEGYPSRKSTPDSVQIVKKRPLMECLDRMLDFPESRSSNSEGFRINFPKMAELCRSSGVELIADMGEDLVWCAQCSGVVVRSDLEEHLTVHNSTDDLFLEEGDLAFSAYNSKAKNFDKQNPKDYDAEVLNAKDMAMTIREMMKYGMTDETSKADDDPTKEKESRGTQLDRLTQALITMSRTSLTERVRQPLLTAKWVTSTVPKTYQGSAPLVQLKSGDVLKLAYWPKSEVADFEKLRPRIAQISRQGQMGRRMERRMREAKRRAKLEILKQGLADMEPKPTVLAGQTQAKKQSTHKLLNVDTDNVENLPFFCHVCRYQTNEFDDFIHHARVFHDPSAVGEFHCDKCPKLFASEGDLKKHLALGHKIREALPPCSICGRTAFKTLSELGIHMTDHKNELGADIDKVQIDGTVYVDLDEVVYEVQGEIIQKGDTVEVRNLEDNPGNEVVGSVMNADKSAAGDESQEEASQTTTKTVKDTSAPAQETDKQGNVPKQLCLQGNERMLQIDMNGHIKVRKLIDVVNNDFGSAALTSTAIDDHYIYLCMDCDAIWPSFYDVLAHRSSSDHVDEREKDDTIVEISVEQTEEKQLTDVDSAVVPLQSFQDVQARERYQKRKLKCMGGKNKDLEFDSSATSGKGGVDANAAEDNMDSIRDNRMDMNEDDDDDDDTPGFIYRGTELVSAMEAEADLVSSPAPKDIPTPEATPSKAAPSSSKTTSKSQSATYSVAQRVRYGDRTLVVERAHPPKVSEINEAIARASGGECKSAQTTFLKISDMLTLLQGSGDFATYEMESAEAGVILDSTSTSQIAVLDAEIEGPLADAANKSSVQIPSAILTPSSDKKIPSSDKKIPTVVSVDPWSQPSIFVVPRPGSKTDMSQEQRNYGNNRTSKPKPYPTNALVQVVTVDTENSSTFTPIVDMPKATEVPKQVVVSTIVQNPKSTNATMTVSATSTQESKSKYPTILASYLRKPPGPVTTLNEVFDKTIDNSYQTIPREPVPTLNELFDKTIATSLRNEKLENVSSNSTKTSQNIQNIFDTLSTIKNTSKSLVENVGGSSTSSSKAAKRKMKEINYADLVAGNANNVTKAKKPKQQETFYTNDIPWSYEDSADDTMEYGLGADEISDVANSGTIVDIAEPKPTKRSEFTTYLQISGDRSEVETLFELIEKVMTKGGLNSLEIKECEIV